MNLVPLIKERIVDTLTRDGFSPEDILVEGTGLTTNTALLYINILKSFLKVMELILNYFTIQENNKIKAFKYNISD